MRRLLRIAIVSIGVVALVRCTDGSPRRDAREVVPRLVDASAGLRLQCADAAKRLSFAVPCPRQVPALRGAAMECSRPPTLCVGLAGERQSQVFFLDFTGFDVGPGYVGVDGKPEGHLIIEARRHADSPPRPCFDGAERESDLMAGRRVTRYTCPGRSARLERLIRHGEGAHAGHVLITWSNTGIDYLASVHGDTAANARLVERIVESIELVT